MCILNASESQTIIDAITEIGALAVEARSHATAIAETAYMDHEGLADVLARLEARAAAAQQWVADKPRQHTEHANH
jgi:hypothetical protein